MYLILCAAMNRVSDLNLAIATYNAGVLPSLSVFNYGQLYRMDRLCDDIIEFKSITNSNDIVISTSLDDVIDINKIIAMNPAYVEILGYNDKKQISVFEKLKESNIKIILKQVYIENISSIKDIAHTLYAIILKNEKSAGLNCPQRKTLNEQVKVIREHYSEIRIVASGGVYDKNDIDEMINDGADGVSIGTLFALSSESKITNDVKNNLIANKNKLSTLKKINSPIFHNCIVFDKNIKTNHHIFHNPPIDSNYTNFLIEGIETGTKGLVYMGHAIKRIDKIETVKEITQRLTGNNHE
jgi:NAD(P)H-dependent flavin oxidoreductase YrpB (nitropropane dioxygenase family)